MNKQVINISVATLVIGFTGCVGGSGLSTPVKQRAQDVDPKVMSEVNQNAPKAFKENLKIKNSKTKEYVYKNQKDMSLRQLKDVDRKLYDLIIPLAKEAKKMYKERQLPEDIAIQGPQWLISDVETLNITLVSTASKRLNGRYSPYNDLLIINYNDSINPMKVQFLVAHEFAHAIALHSTEDATARLRIREGVGALANVATDVLINESYLFLQKNTNGLATTAIDEIVEATVFDSIFNEDDLKAEMEILKSREKGLIARTILKDINTTNDSFPNIGESLQIALSSNADNNGVLPDIEIPIKWSCNLSSTLTYRKTETFDDRVTDGTTIKETLEKSEYSFYPLRYDDKIFIFEYFVGLGYAGESYVKDQSGSFVDYEDDTIGYDNSVNIDIAGASLKAELIGRTSFGLDAKLNYGILSSSNLDVSQNTSYSTKYDSGSVSNSETLSNIYKFGIDINYELFSWMDLGFKSQYSFLPLEYSLHLAGDDSPTKYKIDEEITYNAIKLFIKNDYFIEDRILIGYSEETTKETDMLGRNDSKVKDSRVFFGINRNF